MCLFQFHFESQQAVFYVNDAAAADALKSQHNKVVLPNGFKVRLCGGNEKLRTIFCSVLFY